MIPSEYEQLLAERGTLQRLLADIPESDVLDRGSFLARLEDVEDRIAALGPDFREPTRARLTFRGRPVVGERAIFADFGMRAMSDFVEAVTATAAALTAPLSSSGPIPNRDRNRLLVTGTAVGSFGFALEEYQDPHGDQLPLDLAMESSVSLALTQTLEILQSTLGSDDDLADAIAGVDPRARGAVRTFLDTVAAQDAIFALELRDRVVSFHDVGEVRRSLQRLSQDNVHEEPQRLVGMFQGVLPKRRTFELKLDESGDVIIGKVGPGIVDPNELNDHLYEPARIQVTAVLVGSGRPRYVLNEMPEWLGQPTQPLP
jgi:hypothetical protein